MNSVIQLLKLIWGGEKSSLPLIGMLGSEAVVLGKKTFHIQNVLHETFHSTDFWCEDNGLLYIRVVT